MARTRATQHNRAQSFDYILWEKRYLECDRCKETRVRRLYALNRHCSVPSANSNINTLAIDWLHFLFYSILSSTPASFGNFTCFRCAISPNEQHLPFQHVAQSECVPWIRCCNLFVCMPILLPPVNVFAQVVLLFFLCLFFSAATVLFSTPFARMPANLCCLAKGNEY